MSQGFFLTQNASERYHERMNSFGQLFRITTAGESHGPAMLCIVDGCPQGLLLSEQDIQVELDRRRPGQSSATTSRNETDQVQILSGVFEGKTTGAPIALLVANQDQRSKDYSAIKDLYRPGHADFTYQQKYGIRDYRGGGRASARETLNWVAAGAIAKKILKQQGVEISAGVAKIGNIVANKEEWQQVEDNIYRFLDANQLPALEQLFQQLKTDGDSIGAEIRVKASGVPVGLGEPIFNKLDAEIAKAMMTINAVRGVSLGEGFAASSMQGSAYRDQMSPAGFDSNHSGGTLGGMATGQDILVNVAFKPTSSIKKTGNTINLAGEAVAISTTGRHDPCVAIRAVPICEAMLALVLVDAYLLNKCRTGTDSLSQY